VLVVQGLDLRERGREGGKGRREGKRVIVEEVGNQVVARGDTTT